MIKTHHILKIGKKSDLGVFLSIYLKPGWYIVSKATLRIPWNKAQYGNRIAFVLSRVEKSQDFMISNTIARKLVWIP